MPLPGTRVRARPHEAVFAFLVILALGLALRLIIAYVLLPGSGFGVDRGSFQAWAGELARGGPGGFYERVSFIDYTPGYLYVLWLIGIVGKAIGGIGDLIKLPAIVADAVVAWLIYSMVLELGGARRAARLGAILFLINPVTWFDSAIWGQVDSVGVVFLLLALREAWRQRSERATVLAVVAAVIKPQLGILLPVLAVVLFRRHLADWLLAPRPADDDVRPGLPAVAETGAEIVPLPGPRGDPLFDSLGSGPIRLVTSATLGFATAAVLCFPFGVSLPGLVIQVAKTAGGYPYITVNAFNPWALIESGGNGLAANGTWLRDVAGPAADQAATLILAVPALLVGTSLLLAAILIVGVAVYLRGARVDAVIVSAPERQAPIVALFDERRTLLVALAVLSIAFFVVPTRVHERYLFPFFALGAILAATSLRWRFAYALMAIASFANLYAILLKPFYNNPGVIDWLGIGDGLRSPGGVALVVAAHVTVFAWSLTELRPSAIRDLDETAALEAEWEREEEAEAPESDQRPTAQTGPRVVSGAAVGVGSRSRGGPPRPDGPWIEADADQVPAWVPFGLSLRGILPDRSRRLHGEGGGRFGRLDLWLLVVIVVAALVLRTFRLAEPYRMHFDEVYHARTGTEFLQDWRYGIRHDIYEYTHPHVAKYAMALGIMAAGDDRATSQSQLGTAVRDVLVEPRWDDPTLPDRRAGDRFYVAGGNQLRAYDLATRALVGRWSVPGAASLGLDSVDHRVFVGTDGGSIGVLETSTELDVLRTPGAGGATGTTAPDANAPPASLATLAAVDGPIVRLGVTDDASGLAAALANGTVISLDPTTGAEMGRTTIEGIGDFADGGTGNGLTAEPGAVADPAAAAKALARITGGNAETYRKRLASSTGGVGSPGPIVVLGGFANDEQSAVEAAIGDGRLAGFEVTPVPLLAAAGRAGVSFIAPATGEVVDTVDVGAAVTGVEKVTGIDKPVLYAALADRQMAVVKLGEAGSTTQPTLSTRFMMPGDVRGVAFDEPTLMVHVLGRTPDGAADTIYVVEPHANAVYADARLPFEVQAWAMDTSSNVPSADRQEILVADTGGALAAVDVGNHAFAWRLPGAISGALMAGLVFLLVRTLFRRRDIAILSAILVLADGMLFVQSRIAMNDVYVGLFIVAAYALFAPLWLGRWSRPWAFWVVLPMVGVLLGLALASKWVALYAMAGIAILILGRSALGRILLVLGLILASAILGYMAMAVPKEAVTSGGNLAFVTMMIAITLAAVLITVLHPIAWSTEEVRLALVGPAALGIVVFLVALPLGVAGRTFSLGPVAMTPIELVLLGFVGSAMARLLFRLAGSFGLGPLAPRPDPDDPIRLTEPAAAPPDGWLRPGAMLGLPIGWAALCLALIPLVIYVASYLPWAALGNRITDSWPPGNTGQTLIGLTRTMYDYHNGLRATHAAASPYWAWPLDLKPVWFYQGSFSANTAAAIYDTGNLAAWWLSIPALVFVASQAFRRRSLGLALIIVAFAMQWIPWARIDRATFQYHYYTAVPFVLASLAYLLAELRNGPSPRTWLAVRLCAAAAVLGPALMWLFKGPLCTYVRVTAVNVGSQACAATAPGQIVITSRVAGLSAALIVFGLLVVVQILRLSLSDRIDRRALNRQILLLGLTAVLAIVAVTIINRTLPEQPIVNQRGFTVEPIAFVILVALLPVAWIVATAQDARRFAVGAVVACLIWFVAWYPNLSGLPLPAALANAYQGLLPTYLYAFQFPVNTDPVVQGVKLIDGPPVLLLGMLAATCLIVGYSAWTWRIAAAERAAEARSGDLLAGSRPD